MCSSRGPAWTPTRSCAKKSCFTPKPEASQLQSQAASPNPKTHNRTIPWMVVGLQRPAKPKAKARTAKTREKEKTYQRRSTKLASIVARKGTLPKTAGANKPQGGKQQGGKGSKATGGASKGIPKGKSTTKDAGALDEEHGRAREHEHLRPLPRLRRLRANPRRRPMAAG
eukprot:4242783-Amphidinium_carterae.2